LKLRSLALALAISASVFGQTKGPALRGPAGGPVDEIKGTACTQSGRTLTCSGGGTGGPDVTAEPIVTTGSSAVLTNEKVLPTCAGTDKLTFNGTTISCGADQTGAGGAPTTVPYWTGAADATLSAEKDLSALATGLVLNTAGTPSAYAGASCSYAIQALDGSGAASTCRAAPTIPADISGASFITKIAESSLSNEFALGSLSTGLLKNTTTTGVPTIAVSGTDYAPATSGSAVLLGNGSGGFSSYAGTSCTNQFPRSLSTAGAATCASVSMTADVSGVLPLANGGTNANLTASNGAVAYSGSSAIALSGVGASGQALFSAGAAAPTWGDSDRVVRLTSDYTNATTSMTNTALTWTSPAQVSRSAFTCKLMVKSSATTLGAQFDVTASVAPTTITYWVQWISAAGTAPGTTGTWNHVTATANSTAIGPAAGLTAYTIWTVEGIIVHTSSSSTVTIRGKASGVGTITVGSGSLCQYYVL
jgi:hypothetical protein